MEETRKNTVVTGCRLSPDAGSGERRESHAERHVANVLYERLPKSETDSGESPKPERHPRATLPNGGNATSELSLWCAAEW